jgi:UDP-glucose:(heptosyl)LPS alpha-1,3-glucosyltransferase
LYRLFIAVERAIYTRQELPLVAISRKMEQDLTRCFNRRNRVSLVYHGVDMDRLNRSHCETLREEARRRLEIPEHVFAILLVGNDWLKKGVPCLIDAVASLQNAALRILLCGEDESAPCRELIQRHGLQKRVMILPLVSDVERYYAAADMYVGPSLEDSFAIPPLEAMACGLPVIVSRQAGVSELVTHGLDGFILEDPRDSRHLAELICRVYSDQSLRHDLGARAAETARLYTWERNAREMKKILEKCLREKQSDVLDRRAALPQT